MPILSSRGAGAASAFGLGANTGVALEVDYLIVAGGGAGSQGFAGGGGAGGYRTSFPGGTKITLVEPVTTITVGSGGAAPPAGTNGLPANHGEVSDIGALIETTGGGSGYFLEPATYPDVDDDPMSGGSGAGTGAGVGQGPGNVGGNGNVGGYTPVEGYNGGASFGNYSASGGGGASVAGSNAGPGPSGPAGPGGNGLANSITGSSVTYAGGGGGSPRYAGLPVGSGGSGGGGAGNNGPDAPALGVPGTDELGGGGGGSFYSNSGPVAGSSGGSGVVVIRIPAATAPGTLSASPGTNTVTTLPSGDKVARFTVDGTLTL
jgi:hypothetical protein